MTQSDDPLSRTTQLSSRSRHTPPVIEQPPSPPATVDGQCPLPIARCPRHPASPHRHPASDTRAPTTDASRISRTAHSDPPSNSRARSSSSGSGARFSKPRSMRRSTSSPCSRDSCSSCAFLFEFLLRLGARAPASLRLVSALVGAVRAHERLAAHDAHKSPGAHLARLAAGIKVGEAHRHGHAPVGREEGAAQLLVADSLSAAHLT